MLNDGGMLIKNSHFRSGVTIFEESKFEKVDDNPKLNLSSFITDEDYLGGPKQVKKIQAE